MIERRKHKRYSMPKGTFAIIRTESDRLHNHRRMSIGEIAMVLYKSDAQVMGQVANMSYGGIAFENSNCRIPIADETELDLLMTEQGIYLHNVPFTTLPTPSTGRNRKKADYSHRAVLRFKKLNPQLKHELREMMAHHIG